jgi:hypothetical protein
MNNVLRIILCLVCIVATNVAPVLAACTLSDAPAANSCCCEQTNYDECSITQGSCCSDAEHHDKATPSTPLRTVSVPVVLSSSPAPVRVATLIANAKIIALETTRRPLHLASNKVYLEKRLLLI